MSFLFTQFCNVTGVSVLIGLSTAADTLCPQVRMHGIPQSIPCTVEPNYNGHTWDRDKC